MFGEGRLYNCEQASGAKKPSEQTGRRGPVSRPKCHTTPNLRQLNSDNGGIKRLSDSGSKRGTSNGYDMKEHACWKAKSKFDRRQDAMNWDELGQEAKL